MMKWIAYILAVCAAVYGGIIYNSSSLLFLAGVLFLPFFLYLALLVQRPLLKLSVSQKKYVVEAKEEVSVKLIAINKSRLPIRRLSLRLTMKNLTTGEQRRRKLSYALGGKRTNILFREKAGYGIWEFSWDRIQMYDLLSFFYIRKWKHAHCEVVCLPGKQEVKVVCRGEEASWRAEPYDVWENGKQDRTEVCQIREYRPGDRLLDIHWKLSAKRGQLQAKEYEKPGDGSMFLALNAATWDREWMELVYSLLSGCAKSRRALFLVWKEAKTGTLWNWDVHTQGGELPAMELLLRHPPGKLPHQELEPAGGPLLWIEDNFTLYLDNVKIQEFSRGHVMEELMEMELTL